MATLHQAVGDLETRDPSWLWLKLSVHNTWHISGSFQGLASLLQTNWLDLICVLGGAAAVKLLAPSTAKNKRATRSPLFVLAIFGVGYAASAALCIQIPRALLLPYSAGTQTFPHGCCLVAQAYNPARVAELLERASALARAASPPIPMDQIFMQVEASEAEHGYMHTPHAFQHTGFKSMLNPKQGLRMSESFDASKVRFRVKTPKAVAEASYASMTMRPASSTMTAL
jgi:hypothetical protein